MLELSYMQWAVMILAGMIIGVSKTGLPGMAILAVPLVASVIPAKESTGLILPMLIVGDIFAVAFYRRHAVWGHLVKLMPYAVAGIILGSLVLNYVNNAQLKPIIGGIILAMIAVNYVRMWRIKDETSVPTAWWFPALLGLAAGMTTMMANAAGSILVIYLMAMRLPKNEFLGTGAWYFLLLNCFKVPFSAGLGLINPHSLQFNLVLLPLIILGALAGVHMAKHVPEKAFSVIVQVLAIAGALYLLF